MPSSLVSADDLVGFPDLRGLLLEGRYRVGEVLGVGGMGAVYEAEHVRLGRKVALKVMRPIYMQYRQHVARFLKEARTASQVKHPNVVEILDVGETPDGTVYTVMELLDGEDLSSVLRREGWLPWSQGRDILVQVVAALEAAHEQGVIHRDVKPANCILLRDKSGEVVVKMVDFGIAKFQEEALSDEDPLTKTGEVIGTPAYMAPELSLGRAANARTDVYAVGVLAYKMLTGERPFGGATAVEMHIDQTTRPVRSPRALEPSIPVSVETLILQMLAVDPGDRPADMTQVSRDLQAGSLRPRNTLSMTGMPHRERSPSAPLRASSAESEGREVTVADGPAAAHDDTLSVSLEIASPGVPQRTGTLEIASPGAPQRTGTLESPMALARPGLPQKHGKQTLPLGSSPGHGPVEASRPRSVPAYSEFEPPPHGVPIASAAAMSMSPADSQRAAIGLRSSMPVPRTHTEIAAEPGAPPRSTVGWLVALVVVVMLIAAAGAYWWLAGSTLSS